MQQKIQTLNAEIMLPKGKGVYAINVDFVSDL